MNFPALLCAVLQRFGDYRPDDPSSFNLRPELSFYPQFMFNLRRCGAPVLLMFLWLLASWFWSLTSAACTLYQGRQATGTCACFCLCLPAGNPAQVLRLLICAALLTT